MVRERGKPGNVARQDLSEKQKDLNDTVDRACMDAWRELVSKPDFIRKLFEKTGCLITADGSQDKKIRPQGLMHIPFNVHSGHFKSSLEYGQDMNYVWCTRENI